LILVVGGLADAVTELVCARLAACGYPYRLLDLGVYPSGYQVSWAWRDSGVNGYVEGPSWTLDLDEVTAVYVRYLGAEARMLPAGLQPEMASPLQHEYDTGLMTLLEQLPCLVVNRAAGGMSNSSKAYQALLIRECGLFTPPTLITSDSDAARRFYEACNGEVIFKSLSGIRSIVRAVKPAHLERLPLLAHCPAQFQALIPGDDIRVHTVGDRLFATRIQSGAVDYRYGGDEGHDVAMEAAALPAAVEQSCLRLAQTLGLMLSGIDLKETPSGDYYCFEVNPSPGFLFYEQHTRQPISTALADLLEDGVGTAASAGAIPMT
jgi:glutathione synthase/RimK-type ligase-like ATP-grasp enzyme